MMPEKRREIALDNL